MGINLGKQTQLKKLVSYLVKTEREREREREREIERERERNKERKKERKRERKISLNTNLVKLEAQRAFNLLESITVETLLKSFNTTKCQIVRGVLMVQWPII